MTPLDPATAAFASPMAVIHAACFPEGERWGADAIRLQLGLPGAFGYIASAGGFILARVAADESEILTLAVAPPVQRSGLARALLRRALAEAAARGATSMVLEVAETNRPARALYAGFGFAEIGRRRRYYAGRHDALVLRAATASGSTPG